MRNHWKRSLLCTILMFGILLSSGSVFAMKIGSRGGFVLDCATYQEVYSQRGDTRMVPASMTKVMSAYIIYKALDDGRITKESLVTISPALASFSRQTGFSNVALVSGGKYTIDELLDALFVVSGNAAVMAMAEHLYGSEAAFVAAMNEQIKAWGIDATFADCTGISSRNLVTPRAMATIANRLVTDFPDCLNYAGKSAINFRGTTYYATNKMLPGKTYAYEGTIGLKTGTTSAAGACFTGVVERNGRRLISVIMGAPYSNARYTDSIIMLDYAFTQLGSLPVPAPEIEAPKTMVTTNTFYLNDLPIPGVIVDGDIYLVCIEDLTKYGFDIGHDEEYDALVIINRPDKLMDGIPESDFPTEVELGSTSPKNLLVKDGEDGAGIFSISTYEISGRTAVNVQDLIQLGWVVPREDTIVAVTRQGSDF